MEIAPLQHKGRPNLPFRAAWWLQHGKEVCLYLGPGLEAVILSQHGSLSYTGSMSVWQEQLTSFHLALNVLQGVRKMFPLSFTSTATFSCCNLGMLPVVCVDVKVFPSSNLVAPDFLPEPGHRWSPHSAAEVPSQGTCQAAWVGTWDSTGSVPGISRYKYPLFAES